MKLAFFFIIFTMIACGVRAQSTHIFLNRNLDPVNDSTLALYKAILTKWPADTSLWAVSRYNMKNQLMVEGVYKDRAMTIADGYFKYYYNQDSIHYLIESGVYANGAMFGPWVKYFPDGKKKTLETYRNDVLNGPYEAYNQYDTSPLIVGQYTNGKKDGKWVYPAITDTYKDGVEIATERNTSFDRGIAERHREVERQKKERHFIDPREDKDFVNYMLPQMRTYFATWPPGNRVKEITLSFTVNEDGKLSDGRILEPSDEATQNIISQLIATAKPWKPATSYGQPISQWVFYTFEKDGDKINKQRVDFP